MKKVLVLFSGAPYISRMAEGYLRFYAGDKAEIYRAAIESYPVDPMTDNVMREDNIDISGTEPLPLRSLKGVRFDFLITLNEETRKKIPSSIKALKKVHFSIPSPDGVNSSDLEKLTSFRSTRDLIKMSMLKFIGQELLEKSEAIF
jgi:arsenate reductase (thioredoxin)